MAIPNMASLPELFDLTGRVAVITGGGGLLGLQHARAIAGAGGIPVLLDISPATAEKAAGLEAELGSPCWGRRTDITSHEDLTACRDEICTRYGRLDILINNAAN